MIENIQNYFALIFNEMQIFPFEKVYSFPLWKDIFFYLFTFFILYKTSKKYIRIFHIEG